VSFRVDVPEGWLCASAVFIAPPESATEPLLPTLQTTAKFRTTIAVVKEPVPAGTRARQVLDGQLAAMKGAGVQAKLLASEDLDDGGVFAELSSVGPQGEQVRQLEMIRVIGEIAITTVASVLEGPDHERRKESLRELVLSTNI